MEDAFFEQRVSCPKCRYRLAVEAPARDGWQVDWQCPACDSWTCFTIADTIDPPRPDPAELEAATQRLGEQVWKPINEHRSHPAVAWIEKVGNGCFEDDYSDPRWPVPWWIYRFKRQGEAAYVWEKDGSWFVRGWQPMRCRGDLPDISEVFSFEAALDRLLSSGNQ
jgi:hypothetical protein